MEFFLVELAELLDFVEAFSCRLLTLQMAVYILFRERQGGETCPWSPTGLPSRAGPRAKYGALCQIPLALKNLRKLAEKRLTQKVNGAFHQLARGSLVVAPYWHGQTWPEIDWGLWQLSGWGPQAWHFPLESLAPFS